MTSIGTALSGSATRLMLLGSGELGKEVAIEAQRLGIEVIAVDRYANAPAMQVAHRSHVISMLDRDALKQVIELERPDFVVPEVEAIATDLLVELEQNGFNIVPTARATRLTMDREGIRRLASEELGLPTSEYSFAESLEECLHASDKTGFPCVIKRVMSSSGRCQTVSRNLDDIENWWEIAAREGRGNAAKVIVLSLIHI